MLIDAPSSGVYINTDGEEYTIDSVGPSFFRLENEHGLCVYFNHRIGDPDDNGDYNLRGQGCKDYELGRKWTGKYSTKQTDRFQFIQPNGEPLEIIYAE